MMDVDTVPDDQRPWVRSYVTIGAVQGDFRTRSAVAVVERTVHPTEPEAVSYYVRHIENLDAQQPIQQVARFAGHLAEKTGAARCLLDATTAGAPMLRVWDEQFARSPRRFHAIHVGDRERPELASSRRFTLAHANRLDLLGAVRVALDRPEGLVFSKQAEAGRHALDEYVAKLEKLTAEELEWAPPPSWHLVLAFALGVWQLMEEPPDLPDLGEMGGADTDWQWSDDVRFDRRRLRDTAAIEERQQSDRDVALQRGKLALPARGNTVRTPSGHYDFVRWT